MPLYEHVYLARQDLSAQQVEDLTTQLSGIVGQMGGTVAKTEYWGVKSLNYRIKKNRKAHFVMLRLDTPPAAVDEMERQERINEDIIRFITVRVDAHDEGPSIMLQKRDRDERREERRGRRDDGEGGGFEVAEEGRE